MNARTRSVTENAYLAVAIIVGTLLVVRGLGRINIAVASKPAYDLVVDWNGARAFLEGFNPYTVEGQVRSGLAKIGIGHPPSTFFWIIPLARFDLSVARAILMQISLLTLLIELKLIAVELRVPQPWPSAWLAMALVLSCDWFDYLLFLGQISQLIAFAYVLTWYCLRRGWFLGAGLAVGAACTMKMYPGVLLGLFALGRRWRSLAAAAAVYLLVAAIMTARFGVNSWVLYAGQLRGIVDSWMASIQNQSVHGFVLRFFHPTCGPRGPSTPVATGISTVSGVALLALAGWLSRRAARTTERIDIPFALAATLSVFLSNWAWEHYYVVFVLPIAVIATHLPHMRSWETRPSIAGDTDVHADSATATATAAARAVSHTAAPRFARVAPTLVTAILLAMILGSLAVPILEKARLQSAYAAQHVQQHLGDEWLHLRLHVFEALNMVPVIGLVVVLTLMLWLQERRVEPR